jgi:cytochrome c biogenesis protein CcmG/thiol:disulfide interchange protein DsbE
MKKSKKNILIALTGIMLITAAFYNFIPYNEKGNVSVPQTLKFNIRDAKGNIFKMSSLQGKVLIIDFWDTWCPPCREIIPEFIEMKKKYAENDFEIVGIAFGRDGRETVNKFAERSKINYKILVADPFTNPGLFEVYKDIRAIPTAFIIDKEGNIVKRFEGYRPAEEFEKIIKELF